MALFHLSSWLQATNHNQIRIFPVASSKWSSATRPRKGAPCPSWVLPNPKEPPPAPPVQNTNKSAWFKMWKHVVSAEYSHSGCTAFCVVFSVHFGHLQQHMIHLGPCFFKDFLWGLFSSLPVSSSVAADLGPLVKWQPFPLKISTGQVLVNLYDLGGKEFAV